MAAQKYSERIVAMCDPEIMRPEYARWYFWFQDSLTHAESTRLMCRERDKAAAIDELMKNKNRSSTLFLMFRLATLPPGPFLRIIDMVKNKF